jgi:hypothetical protein
VAAFGDGVFAMIERTPEHLLEADDIDARSACIGSRPVGESNV